MKNPDDPPEPAMSFPDMMPQTKFNRMRQIRKQLSSSL
ncbi:hypothetical protein X907_0289 [Glycocaulis alkaliphilus]|uniref:Uncharacterized protein n=1 Tax=Glycocaulis alkaliphilus TaxID=1434191 RepID=A0A3T0E6I7_9PROT|nr:hypothetical protein X907_0289 [Glycocaulis alkaliphilus]